MSLSLIATTYNQPADLDLYLRCLREQTRSDFEVVIADDGSTAETRAVVDRHRAEWAGSRLLHVWHEDTGYRKARIVNEAVRQSRGDWLIFTDSDHLVDPRFVADHASQQAPRSLFMGRRVDLSPGFSNWVRQNPDQLFGWEFRIRALASRSRNTQRSVRIDSAAFAKLLKLDQVPDLLGSNFSIDRKLLFEVNGFNEANEHYWGEDGDLYARVSHVGGQIRGRKNFAIQLHLWHALRAPKPDAEQAYQRALTDPSYQVCENGIQPRNR